MMPPGFFRSRAATLVAAAFVASLLTACGGGDNAAAPLNASSASLNNTNAAAGTGTVVSNPTIQVSGKVMNVGYLGNTLVCADLNDNGACDADEPQNTSTAGGDYTLSVPGGSRGASLLALVRPGSADSAATVAAPISFSQGWTLAALLEYDDEATTATLNISPITATYYARMRLQGRARQSNQIAMFTRIVFEANIDPVTGSLILPVDFDYVANPRNTLSARIKALSDVLSSRAQTAGAALGLVPASGVMAGWYNTYVAPTATAAGSPVDASKIAALTGTATPEYYLANDYHYFRPRTDAALRFRAGVTETAGWTRVLYQGALDTFDRFSITLSNGSILMQLGRLASGVWGDITVDEGGYYTGNPQGTTLVVNSGTAYLQPRSISFVDGNRITFRMPNNNVHYAVDIADSFGTNYQIEEWVGEQRSYTDYYNGKAPASAPLSTAPAKCNKQYAGSPQQGRNTNATTGAGTGTTASAWFDTCYDYYTAEYYDLLAHDLTLTGTNPAVPGASFYDAWLKEPLLVAPLTKTCGSTTNPMSQVSVLGQQHCNWALDANAGHSLTDLFSPNGTVVNSWNKVYGSTSFTSGGVTTVRTAGSAAQAGLPQQLKLTLVRNGGDTSGSGTLYSEYGAWTATSYSATTEPVEWEIDARNPNMVLVRWPFRDVNDPRVKSNLKSDGTTAATTAPVLPAAHFTASFNGSTFSLAPSNHTAPNYRRLAIVLQDGVFVTGQYYGSNYNYNERHFTQPAMDKGVEVFNYVFNKLYNAGFVDQ